MERQTTVVFGAAGFIGSRVVRELATRGRPSLAVTRPSSLTGHISAHSPRILKVDLESRVSRDWLIIELKTLNRFDAVICAGKVDYAASFETAAVQNLTPLAPVLDLLLAVRGSVASCAYIGSAASRGCTPKPVPLTEMDTRLEAGRSVYVDVKRKCEECFLAFTREHGLPGFVLEPGSLVGGGMANTRTTNTDLIGRILRGSPILSGGASYTSAGCLARGIVSALSLAKPGETYLMAGENLTMKQFARLVLETAHPDGTVKQPVVLPRAVAWAASRFTRMLNPQTAFLGSRFCHVDSGKAERELGYRHERADLVAAITEVIRDLRNGER
jgi:dihydroflavonol-4-reductase